jgi:phosphonate transport system permease protein
MLTDSPTAADVAHIKQQHPQLFAAQRRYLRLLTLSTLAVVVYYLLFFRFYGITFAQFSHGCLEIVFAGTVTAAFLALPLSFLAARNVMSTPLLRPISLVVRRIMDLLRGLDMAIWGLIFVRAVGMGPLAGVLAIVMQDLGLLGKLFAEGHEAVDRSPSRGLRALGANPLQTHRFGIFTQSFPTFLALSLYQIESNTRSAAVLGFVGAGGVGLVYAENMRLWNWDVVMFITLILVVIVMAMDKISALLRARYIVGEEIALFTSEESQRSKIKLYREP